MKEIYVLGVGGSTPLFIELAEACGYKIVGLFHYNDERTGEKEHGFSILGSFDDMLKSDIKGKQFLLSQGNMKIRKDVTDKIKAVGGITPSLIHPTAIVSRFANISDDGVCIGANCIIQADVTINAGSVIRDMALVCHQTSIGNYCFVGPKALVGAHISIEDLAFIGQSSLLVSGKVKNVGTNTLVGAGAVVTKALPANIVVVGNPARITPPIQ